ncbi:MAG: chemotaxis protein CheW [bacterium]
MTSADQSLPELLRGVRAELDAASTRDTVTLARPRAKLAWIASTLPQQRAEARRLLDLAAEAASAIGITLESEDEDQRRLAAVRAAVCAAIEHLTEPEDFGRELLLIQAGQQLLRTLGRDSGDWLRGAVSADSAGDAPAIEEAAVAQDSTLTLDDAAALLLMIEPSEREEMERIHRALETLAENSHEVPLVRTLAGEASASIARVLNDVSVAQDLVAGLAEVSDFVSQAVRARDDAENASVAAPTASPRIAAEPSSMDDAAVVTAPPASPSVSAAPQLAIPLGALPNRAPVELSVPVAAEVHAEVADALPEGDHELIADFVVECRDYLESAEAALLELEANPTDIEAINTVFRAFHTVKGTSGFLGLDAITAFAHEAESLFSRVRDKELPFAGSIPDVALRAADVVKALVDSVDKALHGAPMTRPKEYAVVLTELARIAAGDAASLSASNITFGTAPSEEKGEVSTDRRGQPKLVGTQEWRGEERRDQSSDSSIRVRTDRLDRLIDMVAELVIAQTMIAQDDSVPQVGHHGLARKVSHAGKIVRELHDLSLSMRMVPLKPTFQKMTRLVRDVAQNVGKDVEFVTDGEETEIDRNMVDALSDPLVHMVRNAVDHGIEMPDARILAGKPRHGTVRLSAKHSGGNVLVELRDDGRGLDKERIVAKAIEKGLIESAAKMTESEIFNLIFAPGFSTAAQVTGLSGRGVGMDVVRRNIEALRGIIEISSAPGEGTIFTVRLPLTLAVTDGMLVQVGPERYVIPTTSIHMSFRPERGALTTVAGRGEMVRLREEVMPMFRLHRLFGIEGAHEDPCEALCVVVAVGSQRVALLVDALLGQQQVVAKSLGEGIGKIQGVSGGAILGDGRVGLILDVAELLVILRRADTPEPLRSVA